MFVNTLSASPLPSLPSLPQIWPRNQEIFLATLPKIQSKNEKHKKVLDFASHIWYNVYTGSGKENMARKKTTLPNTAGRKAAQKKYNSKPEQIKNRSARNKARRMMEKKGLVRKGDGKDVDHKNGSPRDNRKGNLQVESKYKNRKDGGPGAR